MSAQIEIDGEMFSISPAAWKLFEDFWGDKAYRQARFVERFQALVLREAAEKIRERASAVKAGRLHSRISYGITEVLAAGYGCAADLIDPDKDTP